MRRKLTALVAAAGCAVAFQPPATALTPPPPPFRITISDQYPNPGQRLVVYFVGRPNTTVKLYIDEPSNALPSVTTSSTGYGRRTFILSPDAKPDSRHSIVLKGPGFYERGSVVIRVQRLGHDVGMAS